MMMSCSRTMVWSLPQIWDVTLLVVYGVICRHTSIGHSWLPLQRHCLSKNCNLLITKTFRLAAVRCPAGLAFDIFGQTCNWKAKVDNCDRLSSKFRNHTSFTHNKTTQRQKDTNFTMTSAQRPRERFPTSRLTSRSAQMANCSVETVSLKECSIENNVVTFSSDEY